MLLIDALKGKECERPPVWVMRQAGRYLPEYQEVRAKAGSFFGLCDDPEMAAEVTLQPIDRFGMDAAIIFSDILVIPRAMGVKVDFVEKKGPVVEKLERVDRALDLETSSDVILESVRPTLEAIKLTRERLDDNKALIGFCGAPWTLALYMIEDSPAKGAHTAASWAYGHKDAFLVLLNAITDASVAYLCAQVEAGANALQVFDSWANQAPDDLFETVVLEPLMEVCRRVRVVHPEVPITIFPRAVQQAQLAKLVAANNKEPVFDGLGLSETTDIAWAAEHLQSDICLQGNLSPAALLTTPEVIQKKTRGLLDVAAQQKRHFVCNLGHGILPPTPMENMAAFIETVRN